MKTLSDVFAVVLTGIYNTESCLSKALDVFAAVATDPGLKAALVSHRKQADVHVRILERVFADFGWPLTDKKPDLVKSSLRQMIRPTAGSDISQNVDAGLVFALQRIGHYKIASYECLHEWAVRLDHPFAAWRLKKMLSQELTDDENLTALAYRFTSIQAGEATQETVIVA